MGEDEGDYEVDFVRGLNGNLHYVKKPVYPPSKPKHRPTITEEIHRPRQPFHQELVVEEETDYASSSSDSDAADNDGGDNRIGGYEEDLSTRRQFRPLAAPSRKNSRNRRITVTVEDASDSECEDEFDSPWRNRHPSPGQWMEPVEPYYG